MSYSKKNLNEVKDSAPEFGFGEIGEARFAMGELGAEQTGLAYHRLKPNMRQRFSHTHEEAEEVYVVLAGGGRMKLDDAVVELRRWDLIRGPPPVTRGVEAGPEGLELLVVNSSGHTSDTAPIPGWWSGD